jgi:hypothetical protein
MGIPESGKTAYRQKKAGSPHHPGSAQKSHRFFERGKSEHSEPRL